jgi:hypothetical protein
MNRKQMIVLASAVALFSLSELFPPLYYKDELSRKRSAGYHFFYNPPTTIETPAKLREHRSSSDVELRHYRVVRDYERLLGQRIILLFVMVGVLLLLEKRRSKLKIVSGIVSLCLGFGVLCLYGLYILVIR